MIKYLSLTVALVAVLLVLLVDWAWINSRTEPLANAAAPAVPALRIAVASNFANTMQTLIAQFEQQTQFTVQMSVASTGKHYAQITQGAPFDLFFAADSRRPELLLKHGKALPNSDFIYAQGHLALMAATTIQFELQNVPAEDWLSHPAVQYVAMAHADVAPYGAAAEQLLMALNLPLRLAGKAVRGENVAQAYQFVEQGHAQLGIVSFAQMKYALHNGSHAEGWWEVPTHLYTPIEQRAVALTEHIAVAPFMTFMQSTAVKQHLKLSGYSLP